MSKVNISQFLSDDDWLEGYPKHKDVGGSSVRAGRVGTSSNYDFRGGSDGNYVRG